MSEIQTKLLTSVDEVTLDNANYMFTQSGNAVVKTPVADIMSAIIESGSNENGNYIKFADGTMICWMNISVTDQACENAYGSLYIGTRVWYYPQEFVANPTCHCSEFLWGTGASWGSVRDTAATYAQLQITDAFTRPSGTYVKISASAIGKWK